MANSADPGGANNRRLGRYFLVRKIGEGDTGAVYEAIQESLDRKVAVKVLHPHVARSGEGLDGFLELARIAGALDYPSIVRIYDFGEDRGYRFFSMEFVDGRTAREAIKQDGSIPVAQALEITRVVVDALRYAWERDRVVHGNIQPANILLDNYGRIKLADLGLSPRKDFTAMKARGSIRFRSVAYASPEEAENAPNIDFRSDFYSLGCSLFHMLTGKPPFAGATADTVLKNHVTRPFPDIRTHVRDIPGSLNDLLQKMCAKEPDDRFQSHGELLKAIDSILRNDLVEIPEGILVTEDESSSPADSSPTSKKQHFDAILIAGTLLLIALVAVFAFLAG